MNQRFQWKPISEDIEARILECYKQDEVKVLIEIKQKQDKQFILFEIERDLMQWKQLFEDLQDEQHVNKVNQWIHMDSEQMDMDQLFLDCSEYLIALNEKNTNQFFQQDIKPDKVTEKVINKRVETLKEGNRDSFTKKLLKRLSNSNLKQTLLGTTTLQRSKTELDITKLKRKTLLSKFKTKPLIKSHSMEPLKSPCIVDANVVKSNSLNKNQQKEIKPILHKRISLEIQSPIQRKPTLINRLAKSKSFHNLKSKFNNDDNSNNNEICKTINILIHDEILGLKVSPYIEFNRLIKGIHNRILLSNLNTNNYNLEFTFDINDQCLKLDATNFHQLLALDTIELSVHFIQDIEEEPIIKQSDIIQIDFNKPIVKKDKQKYNTMLDIRGYLETPIKKQVYSIMDQPIWTKQPNLNLNRATLDKPLLKKSLTTYTNISNVTKQVNTNLTIKIILNSELNINILINKRESTLKSLLNQSIEQFNLLNVPLKKLKCMHLVYYNELNTLNPFLKLSEKQFYNLIHTTLEDEIILLLVPDLLIENSEYRLGIRWDLPPNIVDLI